MKAKIAKKAPAKSTKTSPRAAKPAADTGKPVLLSGGNPQIAKAYGDAPVQAYIAAMPGWKSDLGRRLDTLITRIVPKVQKAVKWNSPLYSMDGQSWFLGLHCFDKYIKLAFFSAARRCGPCPRSHPSRRRCATSTSMRATSSTKRRWPIG